MVKFTYFSTCPCGFLIFTDGHPTLLPPSSSLLLSLPKLSLSKLSLTKIVFFSHLLKPPIGGYFQGYLRRQFYALFRLRVAALASAAKAYIGVFVRNTERLLKGSYKAVRGS